MLKSEINPSNMLYLKIQQLPNNKLKCLNYNYYRPQRSCKVMFLQASVILLTGGDYLTRSTPPGPGTPHPAPRTRCTTPLDQVHPPDQAPPQDQVPPDQTPPPPVEQAGRYGQRAGGTHPTGMQSCYKIYYFSESKK